ncbi:MAG: phosphoglycerate dehydrogenase [Nitrosomonadaceae bacterium]|jgi:D-3-phosphoglycerate dehydrogenase|nr:phosphoglycerate dehydrogenase [Nitrosomonadaceae bacterium]
MSKLVISTSSFDVEGNSSLNHLVNSGMHIVRNSYKRKLTEDEAIELLGEDTIGMIAGIEPLTERVFSSAKNLKVVSRCGAGLDSVELAAAKLHGISVFNTPEAPAQAVAELTMGLMLAALRRICQTDRLLRANEWPRMQGQLFAAQTVGIIGLGHIGKRVARLSQAFDARVIAHDPHIDPTSHGVESVSLEELFAEANVISLHVPYTTDTHHLLDAKSFARMKPGSIIINAARGGLIDEAALDEALISGHLGMAALDVFEQEPYHGPLTKNDRMILTSHIGSLAKESRKCMELEAAENLLKGLINAGLIKDDQTNV